jgi:hypothetical protein
MRAAVFVRYHSGDGFGHVGWAFDAADGLVDAGSVENHSGHVFTPATHMGFWNDHFTDPVAEMRKRNYDDVKWIEVENADPVRAHRTALWIEHEAYKALHRNCEDDVYDVLRAYGVDHLAWPTFVWIPNRWFKRFRGVLEHIEQFVWQPLDYARGPSTKPCPEVSKGQDDTGPWKPTWRRPWHPHFHLLRLRGLAHLLHIARH